MKQVIGSTHRREGRRGERLFQIIQCQECGAISYERRKTRVQAALQAECRSCKAIASKQRKQQLALERAQDKALIDVHRSATKLHQRGRSDPRITHGLCRGDTKRTYNIWKGMMSRCYNPNTAGYHHYGGRGISVCQRWHDVTNFVEDMGIARDDYSLERHDVNGNYEPFNCSWIPKCDQPSNRRCCYSNRGITDPKEYQKRKTGVIKKGSADLDTIPFGDKNGLGWWRELGLYENPYIYGPMPWKKTSKVHRRAEAIANGVFVPSIKLKKIKN